MGNGNLKGSERGRRRDERGRRRDERGRRRDDFDKKQNTVNRGGSVGKCYILRENNTDNIHNK